MLAIAVLCLAAGASSASANYVFQPDPAVNTVTQNGAPATTTTILRKNAADACVTWHTDGLTSTAAEAWTAYSTTASDGQGEYTITPEGCGSPNVLTVTNSPGTKSVGTYNTAVNFSQNGTPISNVANVRMIIQSASSSPNLSVTPTSFTMSKTSAGPEPQGTFTVKNTGGGTLSYSISDSTTGFSYSRDSGTTGTTTTSALGGNVSEVWNIHPAQNALAPGTYTDTIQVNCTLCTGGQQTVIMSYTINPGDGQAPSTPTGLTKTASTQTSVTASWNPSTDNVGVTGYNLARGTNINPPEQNVTSPHTITGLTCGTNYSIKVQALDAAGNASPLSSPVGMTTSACAGDTTAPSVPTGLTQTASTQTSVTMGWTAATDNVAVTGYDTYRGGTLDGSNVSGTSYTYGGLACGTTYTGTVRSRDAAGNVSAQSTGKSLTTAACSTGVTFSDDFTGAAGAAPDSTKWADYGPGCGAFVGWGSIQCGQDSLDGAGHLALASTPTAGRGIQTLGKFGFQYGTVSAWIKMPTQAGYWPGWWTLNGSQTGSELLTGESDITEVYTQFNGSNSRVHVWNGGTASWDSPNILCCTGTSLSAAYHKYSAKYEPGVITYYMDDVQVGQVTKAGSPSPWGFGPDVTRNNVLILDNAVGGAGQSAPTANGTMLVDRVEYIPLSTADTTAPSVPTGLAQTSSTTTTANVSWNAATDNVGVTGYDTFRGGVAQGSNVSGTTYQFTGLTCGTSYTVTVRSRDAAGNVSAQSTGATITTAACTGLPARWSPAKLTTWYWQIGSVPTNLTRAVAAYDVDGENASASTVSTLHTNGKKVVCYYSAGTYEPGRSDSASFAAADKGSAVQGWPGEFWLDTRSANVRSIMVARMQACKNKGFDAVEPDNVDGYTNSPGFPLTATTQLDYNQYIAAQAHALGLAVFLKNDVDQLSDLAPFFDGAINEECIAFAECGGYSAFLSSGGWQNAGKPVLGAEYNTISAADCSASNSAGRMTAQFNLNLDGTTFVPCWPSTQPIDLGGTTTAGP